MTLDEALKRMGECVHMVKQDTNTSRLSANLDEEALELLRGVVGGLRPEATLGELIRPTPTLNVEQFIERRELMITAGRSLIRMGEDFRNCTHKNTDGSDARFSAGSNGELLCICGNRWD
jgi:hypothetical protein